MITLCCPHFMYPTDFFVIVSLLSIVFKSMKRSRADSERNGTLEALKSGAQALTVASASSSRELVCRDEHAKEILDFLMEPVHHTMQVFGMPGTGKTATVHHAVSKLAGLTNDRPTAVILNGYVIQKSVEIHWTLYSHLMQSRLGSVEYCAAEQCADQLEKRFRHGWGRKVSLCVIVIDEVDRVLERHSKGLFRIIDWLSLPHTRCKLITISNSMDLAADAKTKSRLDVTKQLVFLPYGIQELKKILENRVSSIHPKLFSDQALNLLCHQIASHYGDVRRLLQSASAAVCGVLMRLEDSDTSVVAHDGIVTLRDVHGVVRQIFHDRFVEFVKAIHSPLVFIMVALMAKETEELYNRNASDFRIPLERLFVITKQTHQRIVSGCLLSRAAFLEEIELFCQVSLIDVSLGDDRIPISGAEAILESTDDVFVSLLQPFQTVVDSCRLHDEFGQTLGVGLL